MCECVRIIGIRFNNQLNRKTSQNLIFRKINKLQSMNFIKVLTSFDTWHGTYSQLELEQFPLFVLR